MLELYHCAYSLCSQKVRICLAEKEVDWLSREVDLASGEQTRPEYLAINPNGTVPAAIWQGRSIVESSVICEFVEEVFSGRRLAPEDPVERAGMRAWLRFIDEIATPAIRVPSLGGAILRNIQSLSDEAYDALIASKPVRQFTFRKLGRTGFSDSDRAESNDQLNLTMHRMEKALGSSRWLAGDEYTIADACMTPIFVRLSDLDLERYWTATPRVAHWFNRVRLRPSFDLAFYAGSRFPPAIMAAPADVSIDEKGA